MYCIKSCLFAGTSLALAIVATSAPSAAQTAKGEDGIGAGAGNSPPIDQLRGGAAMPDAATKMDAPPMPPDDGVGQAAPAPSPDQTPPDDGTKKDDGPPNPD
jgi:hypothetical protein